MAFISTGPPGASLAFDDDPPLPDTNCTNAGPVPPDGTCTLEVAFTPDVAGEYAGTIVVSEDGAQVGPTVQLSGTGIPPVELPPAAAFGTQPLATIGAPQTAR